MIGLNDFRRQWADTREEATGAFEALGESGWYILGPQVAQFEAELAAYCHVEQAVGVASGLDAIELSLKALGCRPGDKVITTPVSAFATTLAICKLGAIPVFADVDNAGLVDLNIVFELLRANPTIRFFVPVHLYGHAMDLDSLSRLQTEFDVQVVEDCAQAIGTLWQNRHVGTAGAMGALSFYPTKNLGALGDAGAVISRKTELAEQVRTLRDYGQVQKYRHEVLGYNSRLDELQATLLRTVGLKRLNGWIARRRQIAARYLDGIRHHQVRMCVPQEHSVSSWHLFPVVVKDVQYKQHFRTHLNSLGVLSGEHYPVAIPDQRALKTYSFEAGPQGIERARSLCKCEVSLPIHPYLTDDEVSTVIDAVNSWRV